MTVWGRGRQELLFVIYLLNTVWIPLYVPVQHSDDLTHPRSVKDTIRPTGFSFQDAGRPVSAAACHTDPDYNRNVVFYHVVQDY